MTKIHKYNEYLYYFIYFFFVSRLYSNQRGKIHM